MPRDDDNAARIVREAEEAEAREAERLTIEAQINSDETPLEGLRSIAARLFARVFNG